MSYNTRRSGGFGGGPQQNVGNIGQRRPVVTNNFVPGGQLNQNKPGTQMSNQQRPAQQQQHQPQSNTNINFRTQQQPAAQNQGYQTAQQPPPLPPQTPPQPQIKPEVQQTPPKPVVTEAPSMNPPNPVLDNSNSEEMEHETTEDEESSPKKKPFWANKSGNKISKKEKMRRRNLRLSKILQPKNAIMILNELCKSTSYNIEEITNRHDINQFKCTVVADGTEHVGLGRSKIQAKSNAAEVALKDLIRANKLTDMKTEDEGTEKMEVSEDDTQVTLPWQHVASFALFKLFCSWGDELHIAAKGGNTSTQNSSNGNENKLPPQCENRPAKKMPANPETMNPLMLINQMLPQAQFEEIGKSGNPPNVTYSFRCNVENQSFIGTGPNKKAAKKLAAFGACSKILKVTYPTDVYIPIY